MRSPIRQAVTVKELIAAPVVQAVTVKELIKPAPVTEEPKENMSFLTNIFENFNAVVDAKKAGTITEAEGYAALSTIGLKKGNQFTVAADLTKQAVQTFKPLIDAVAPGAGTAASAFLKNNIVPTASGQIDFKEVFSKILKGGGSTTTTNSGTASDSGNVPWLLIGGVAVVVVFWKHIKKLFR